jgi:hypothetical protein
MGQELERIFFNEYASRFKNRTAETTELDSVKLPDTKSTTFSDS